MKFIEPDTIPELVYFPYVVGAMVVLGLIVWFTKSRKAFLTWTIVLALLGILGMLDFYLWMYDYGHNLDPKAPIKVEGMVYQPPLIGSKWLLNFKADSWPHLGGIALGISIIMGFGAVLQSKKESNTRNADNDGAKKKKPYSKSNPVALLLLSALFFWQCSTDKVPIVYGEDHCVHCMMKIVQTQYGAEIMSNKGKAYKFDAVECLIDFVNKAGINPADIKGEFVTPYTTPGNLERAEDCFYLRSPELPSPMGMFITALASEEEAAKYKAAHGGEIYSWNELKKKFEIMPAVHQHH